MMVADLEFTGLPTAGDGVSVREDRGQLIVGVGGQKYDLQTAVRLGLVRVS